MRNNIDRLRRGAGLTVQQLADKIGVSRQYMTDLKHPENGRARLNADTIEKLCKVLKCTPADIFADDTGSKASAVNKSSSQNILTNIENQLNIHALPDEPIAQLLEPARIDAMEMAQAKQIAFEDIPVVASALYEAMLEKALDNQIPYLTSSEREKAITKAQESIEKGALTWQKT